MAGSIAAAASGTCQQFRSSSHHISLRLVRAAFQQPMPSPSILIASHRIVECNAPALSPPHIKSSVSVSPYLPRLDLDTGLRKLSPPLSDPPSLTCFPLLLASLLVVVTTCCCLLMLHYARLGKAEQGKRLPMSTHVHTYTHGIDDYGTHTA
ncbi:hypothetical protein CSOJ01_01219 [Colletotrichum sojae]|uniref:Uncharacterized protein n=1 Tax=Colletotrichum sojae TaxID=2175907 RepID=A0A8H6N491_9PEZI|nr:hypothetical protein CSOJ01_01219 [Colletotrichum sojae]